MSEPQRVGVAERAPLSPAGRPSWLRRNVISLAVLAVLLQVAIVVIGGNEWLTAKRNLEFLPIHVASGGRVEYAQSTFGPAVLRAPTADDDLDVPSGARGVVVHFDVVPGDEALLCSVVLRETGGSRRQWDPAGLVSPCQSEPTGPYSADVPFLLPSDAKGPFVADVSVSELERKPRFLPPFIRFSVG